MTIIQFIIAYLIIGILFPILDKLCELITSILTLGIAIISVRLTELQVKATEIAESINDSKSTNHRVIGFTTPIQQSDYNEEYEEGD